MNKCNLFLAFSLIFTLSANLTAQPIKESQLSQKIDYLFTKYQDLRNQKSEILRLHGWDSKQMKENEAHIQSAFELNHTAAKKILEQYGFPGHRMVGAESTHNYWEMVQHFNHDVEFQMKVLRLMERAVKADDASAKDFAYLADRVLLNMNREQYYGTQVKYDKKQGTYVPIKIAGIKQVNSKRLAIGLPPLKESITDMNSKYDGTVTQKPRVKKYHDTVGRPKEVIERLRNN